MGWFQRKKKEGDQDVVTDNEELSPHTALGGEREISVPESEPLEVLTGPTLPG